MSGWDNKSVEDLVKVVGHSYQSAPDNEITASEGNTPPADVEYLIYEKGKLVESPASEPPKKTVKDHVLAAQLGISPHSKVYNLVKAKMEAGLKACDEKMTAKSYAANKYNLYTTDPKVAEAATKCEPELAKTFNECEKGTGPSKPPVWLDESVQMDQNIKDQLLKGTWQGMISVPADLEPPKPGTIGAIEKSTTSGWWSSPPITLGDGSSKSNPAYVSTVYDKVDKDDEIWYSSDVKYYKKSLKSPELKFKGASWTHGLMPFPTKTISWQKLSEQYTSGGMSKIEGTNGESWYGPTPGQSPTTAPPPPSSSGSAQPMWTFNNALPYISELQPRVKKCGYHLCLGGGVLNKGKSNKDLDLYFLPLDNDDFVVDSHALLLRVQSYFGGVKIEPIGLPYEAEFKVPYIFKGKFYYTPFGSAQALRIDIFVMGNKSHREGVRFFLTGNAQGEEVTLQGEQIVHYSKKKEFIPNEDCPF